MHKINKTRELLKNIGVEAKPDFIKTFTKEEIIDIKPVINKFCEETKMMYGKRKNFKIIDTKPDSITAHIGYLRTVLSSYGLELKSDDKTKWDKLTKKNIKEPVYILKFDKIVNRKLNINNGSYKRIKGDPFFD